MCVCLRVSRSVIARFSVAVCESHRGERERERETERQTERDRERERERQTGGRENTVS